VVDRWVGYRGSRQSMVTHRALPTTIVPLIVSFGPVQRLQYQDGSGHLETRSFVAGLQQRPVVVEADAFVGIQIDLTPLGAYRMVGGDARSLADSLHPIDEALGADGRRYEEQINAARTWADRFAVVADFVDSRMRFGPVPSRQIRYVWTAMAVSHGSVRVADVAGEVGWSTRHLSTRFAAEVGVTPKLAARLARFHHTVRLLRSGEAPLADIALIAGYSDQAHMTNEVRGFAGSTPKELRTSFVA